MRADSIRMQVNTFASEWCTHAKKTDSDCKTCTRKDPLDRFSSALLGSPTKESLRPDHQTR